MPVGLDCFEPELFGSDVIRAAAHISGIKSWLDETAIGSSTEACKCTTPCACKVRGNRFTGARLHPAAQGGGWMQDVQEEMECACDLSEVGGPNPGMGGGYDCHCSEARCACETMAVCFATHEKE